MAHPSTSPKQASAEGRRPAKASKPRKAGARGSAGLPPRPALELGVAGIPSVHEGALPRRPAPELATRVPQAPPGDSWVHEIKFDGYRLLALFEAGRVTLLSRNGKDWTRRFPKLVDSLQALGIPEAVLDGELVALQPDGTSSFRQLQEALAAKRTDHLIYEVFDLLFLDGYDLTDAELVRRKEILRALLTNRGVNNRGCVRYVHHFEGKGTELYDEVCQLGLEGIVCKRRASPYQGGRTADWLKVKCVEQGEFVVGGFTDPSSARIGFGALLLGAYDEAGRLVYVGNVGTGFSAQRLRSLYHQLRELEIGNCPFDADEQRLKIRGVHWVRPELVANVEYSEWTRDGSLRHPVFRGLREDKSPREIVLAGDAAGGRALEIDMKQVAAGGKAPSHPVRRGTLDDAVAGVRLTHPDRVLYEAQGITKLHLARYYEQIASWVLPHLARRPLALVRCPAGRAGSCFFQKHPPEGLSNAVGRVAVRESSGEAAYLYVESLEGIVALVQIGVLEFHCWGSRIESLERPDLLVLDLDPGPGVTWPRLLEGAWALKARVERLGLTPFPKLTGGKGLHLVVPLAPEREWEEVKRFAAAIAEGEARAQPERFTANMAKARRQGRIFIDYLRNGRGATAIAPYSTRAREGAPVAVPIAWDELDPASRADRYAIDTVRRRLAALRKDPWEGFDAARTALTDGMLDAVGVVR